MLLSPTFSAFPPDPSFLSLPYHPNFTIALSDVGKRKNNFSASPLAMAQNSGKNGPVCSTALSSQPKYERNAPFKEKAGFAHREPGVEMWGRCGFPTMIGEIWHTDLLFLFLAPRQGGNGRATFGTSLLLYTRLATFPESTRRLFRESTRQLFPCLSKVFTLQFLSCPCLHARIM